MPLVPDCPVVKTTPVRPSAKSRHARKVYAVSVAGGCVAYPRHRGIVVDAGYTDKTIRIENAQPAMMKLNDAFLAQRAQNAVHMDARKSRSITDMLLGERQLHQIGRARYREGSGQYVRLQMVTVSIKKNQKEKYKCGKKS